MKEYNPDIYLTDPKNTCRFALGVSGSNPLFVVGLNPSTADDQKPDQTISKVMGFAHRNGFDGFIMLNLYPKRTPYPEKLHKRFNKELFLENRQHVGALFKTQSNITILAAWGEIINVRSYMKRCLKDIAELSYNNNSKWVMIGGLTKSGHPRHPSRASYKKEFRDFDVLKYLKSLQ